jgi:hypothetical protein
VHVWRVLGASLVGSRFEALGHGRELAVEREMGKSRNSASSGMARKGRFSSASTTLPIFPHCSRWQDPWSGCHC